MQKILIAKYFSKKEKELKFVFYGFLFATTLILLTTFSNDCGADSLDQIQAVKESYLEHFRITGERNTEKATSIENRLKSLKESAKGKLLAQTLFELATIQRITNQFEAAIGNYERAVDVARENSEITIEFNAWVGIARSHAYGTRNHGAAAAAFERAIVCAGKTPTEQQRYDMADYSSQLQAGRGELESALLNALEAIKLAQDDSQRFYAFLDAGDVFEKFAESCDYRKILDAKSNEENDAWGACKRAVRAAKSFYEKAEIITNKRGWDFLKKESKGSIDRLDARFFIINKKAYFELLFQNNSLFDGGNVLVNEDFSSGGSALSGDHLGALIAQLFPQLQANDPLSIYIKGVKADLDGNPAKALEYFNKAAQLLGTERDSLFDLRQRGTVIENRPHLIRDLGLRLLALQKYDESFVSFESIRSHGLEWLATAFDKSHFTDAERSWIASLVQFDSLISAKQNELVETSIAGIEHGHSLELLKELRQLEQRRLEQQNKKQFQSVMQRLKSIECNIPTMPQLKTAVDKAGIPVFLYWVTSTNVIVWVVSSKGVEVKTVFLPEAAVIDKVDKLRKSCSTADQTFDKKSAEELYAYLIKPFANHINDRQVIIIPQGPLVSLPFEALIDAADGKFLAEKLSISYAPNAAFAIRALKGRLPDSPRITAIYDNNIENETHEISNMKLIKGLLVNTHSSNGMDHANMIKLLGNAEIAHLLLHGEYNYDDPLQSTLRIGEKNNRRGRFITAAELLAVNWRSTQLAVFSSCESAIVKARISNEQLGISWALFAGGADHVVLSRWRVNAASNADWMATFYNALQMEKMSPALAANAAMRKMIRSNKAHPYYWAGPQVFGR